MLTAKDIQGYRLFSGLQENELSKIAGLCTRCTYAPNTIIFKPDMTSDDVYLVEEGKDAIEIEIPLGPPGSRIIIHTLSKGEAFGWAPLVSKHVKTATARCLEEVRVIAINGQALLNLLEEDNHIGFVVMKNMTDIVGTRLAYTTIAFRHEIRKLKNLAREPIKRVYKQPVTPIN
jgi:CRP/FNR family transcriptional regulator, cyclic AMP receptor protein